MKNKINNLIKHGYFKFKFDTKYFNENSKILKNIIKKKYKKKINLEDFHLNFDESNINELRLFVFNQINKDKNFKKNLYLGSKENIELCVGSELCVSDINLSIQLPSDKTSILDMHTDFFSGESLFQINLWVPFVKVKKTQSMFIINPKNSLNILKKIKKNNSITFNDIRKKYSKYIKWINFKKGEAMVFSPNCLHGNVVNLEKKTRWSTNIRYKNLFSPYNDIKNEKQISSFYKPFTPKGVTLFNLEHNFDEISKK